MVEAWSCTSCLQGGKFLSITQMPPKIASNWSSSVIAGMTSGVKTRFASGAKVCNCAAAGFLQATAWLVLFLDDSLGFSLISFLYFVNIILEDLGENML